MEESMKKVLMFTFIFVLLASLNLAFAGDLKITFDDNTDVANWSHFDETNFYTTETFNATGGVDGSGCLELGDAGYDMLDKRAVTATVGTMFRLTIDIKTENWDDQETYPIYIQLQGIDSTPDTVHINGATDFTTFTVYGTADNADGYIRIKGSNTGLANKVWIDNVDFDDDYQLEQDIFFSEAIEGSSYNKAYEIYNPTDHVVSLDGYAFPNASNDIDVPGQYEFWNTFDEGATIAPGEVFVLAHPDADPAILEQADMTSFTFFGNGDDGFCLVKGTEESYIIIDGVGDWNARPSTGWDVAGVTAATANHTLVRKETVTMGNPDWTASAGTNADDSEWIVYDNDTFDYLGAHPGMPTPGLVNITFRLNTSTNLDTLTAENGFVEMRGALNTVAPGNLPNEQVIAWDNTSTLEMTNVGGDYWELTVAMEPEDTLYYKYWTGFSPDQGTYSDGGWEMGFNESNGLTWDTRTFISGTTDSVLDVAYYHPKIGDGTKVDQDWSPFESKNDSIAVYFRVNMGGLMEAESFDPTVNGPIGMRGDPANSGQIFSWDVTNIKLNWEENSIYDGSFWSGVVYFAKDSVVEGVSQSFKFYAENSGSISWEDGSDHKFKYPVGLKDTTIAWTWFSGKKITGTQPVEGIVTWRVSTEALEALGLFDRGIGDKIEVRGPRGTWSAGEVELFYNPLLQEWTSANESFKYPPGTEIYYKYFVAWDSSRFDETSANYIAGLINDDGTSRGWEEPAITGGGNRTYTFLDAAEQTVKGDFGFQRQFFNSVPANGVYDHDLTVTWQVDMTNATDADSNLANSDNLFRPGTDSVFVIWDGELIAVTQGQDMWGGDNVAELKDLEGDMIYSGSFTIKVSDEFPNGWYQLGYKIAYTTDEPGVPIITQGTGGVEPGRRYMQYIHPDNIYENPSKPEFPLTEWPADYTLPVVNWRTDTKLYVEYPPPALTEATAISEKDILPLDFSMEQNYPNPFNPSTTIKYTMADNALVTIKVYDITGQLVKTLINGHQNPGAHTIQWNGKNNSNTNVASGLYFVEMVSGKFTKVNKMMLIR
jgi:hypothetical protein